MANIAGFPFFPLEFTKDGNVFQQQQMDDILNGLAGVTDLLVISHGWNNDKNDAQQLYNGVLNSIRGQFGTSKAKDRTVAVVGVFWPSKKFAEADLTPGGGAAFEPGADVKKKVDELAALTTTTKLGDAPASNPQLEEAKKLAGAIAKDDKQAAAKFVDIIRNHVKQQVGTPAPGEGKEDASDAFFKNSADQILASLDLPFDADENDVLAKPGGGAAGGIGSVKIPIGGGGAAGGVGDFFKSMSDRVKDVLNLTTSYVMKKRAGTVGQKGLAPVLDKIQAKFPALRFHLIGHSFGGRLVTAAAANVKNAGEVASVTLLQAAYSHNGLSQDFDGKGSKGFFADVVAKQRVRGAIIITHTKNDKAVGIAYPIASRLAGDRSAAFGDANDPFGGMGRNGAQHSNALDTFRLTKGVDPGTFAFQGAKIYNLLADDVITGHSDIQGKEVAGAILAAVAAT